MPCHVCFLRCGSICGARCSLANWIVNAYEFAVVGKRCFHLHLAEHFRDAVHDLIARQDFAALGHEFSDGLAVPCSLQDEICYQGNALGVVKLYASGKAPTSDYCSERDHQLVFFAWREVHKPLRSAAAFSMTTSLALGMGLD